MNKSLLMFGLGMVLSAPLIHAAGVATVQLTGHVPAVVSHLQSKGHLAGTNLDLAIGLPLRNREALTNLLAQITDPSSTNYHKYLTPEQFAEQFGPTAQDYQAIIDFAQQNNLKVTATHGNRVLLDVNGLSTDIEKAFHVTLNMYQHPTEARQFFAPNGEPSVPAGLQIQDISGLDSYRRPHSHLVFKPSGAGSGLVSGGVISNVSTNAKPNNGSGPQGNYIGNDFRNAYIPGSTLNGSGQTVGLVQFDGYFASDIQAYESLAGRTNVPLHNVLIDGFNGAPTGSGGEIEVSLDIEMLVSMAPGLSNIILYEGSPFNFHPNDVLNRIATDDSASQISCSWGWTGGPTATTDQIFQQMALQGQTFFTASGDSDAYPPGAVDNPNGFGTPADSVFVTCVGGTTLTMTQGGASRISETVWNWGVEFGFDGAGACGGISSFYKIPYWQTNVNMTANQGSTTFRNFPDVAMTADNVLVIADGGVLYLGNGGTSCASPLWAGYTALLNQQESINNHAPIGFINPALYAIANSSKYSSCFNDITTGNNTWSGSPNLFFAVTNYDLCTGLGTPAGTNLINALMAAPAVVFQVSAPPAPYGATMSALNGGTPNGTWTLFVQDDAQFNTGMISNGWFVNLTLGSPVGGNADLALTMSASASSVLPGSNVVYYLTITNYGGLSTSTNVTVQDTLPADTTLISSNLSAGSIVRSGSQFNWVVGNLVTNGGATLAITVKAPSTAGSILNFALANSDTPDANPDDDSASVTVNVGSPSPPQLSGNYTSTNGNFTLTIGGSSGSAVIQASTNLVNWVSIYTNSVPYTFSDPKKTNYPYRFYRAVTGP